MAICEFALSTVITHLSQIVMDTNQIVLPVTVTIHKYVHVHVYMHCQIMSVIL